jgi:hypothetical protein
MIGEIKWSLYMVKNSILVYLSISYKAAKTYIRHDHRLDLTDEFSSDRSRYSTQNLQKPHSSRLIV